MNNAIFGDGEAMSAREFFEESGTYLGVYEGITAAMDALSHFECQPRCAKDFGSDWLNRLGLNLHAERELVVTHLRKLKAPANASIYRVAEIEVTLLSHAHLMDEVIDVRKHCEKLSATLAYAFRLEGDCHA